MTWTIPVAPDLAAELADSLNAGPIVDDLGRRMLTEEQLARFSGLSIQIYAESTHRRTFTCAMRVPMCRLPSTPAVACRE